MQALASRAALYERARAENKRLHNAVQDLKGSIRVFCRVRPRVPGTDGVSDLDVVRVVVDDEGSPDRLVVRAPTRRPREDPDALRTYAFDRVFGPDAAQSDVYEECSALIRCVCDGYNVCFLAYGQTGSGKTHTMSGDRGALSAAGFHPSEALGVNDRALRDVFAVAAERASATSYEVSVSVLEIYNERCVDLLAEEADARVDVTACGSKTGENVPDATARRVSSAEEVREVMREGEANRATGATAMNERSSRSHSVVMVRVDGVAADSGARTRGVLYLVDLAGSERLARSEARGERLKESQHINKSLSALGDVVGALRANSPHVPYRNSKLTTLLQGALGPSGKALCFVHVSPAEASAGETVSTLDFATRVASVELGRAKKNTDVGGVGVRETSRGTRERAAELAEENTMALRRELDEQANIAAAAARAAAEANLRAEDATRRLAENVGDVVGTVNPSNPRTNFSTNPFDDFSANPFDTSVDRVAGTPAGSVYRPSPSTSAGHASSSGSARSLASRGSRGSSRRISTGSSGGGGFGSVVDARESYTSGVFLDEEMSADGSVSFDLSPAAGSVASGSAGSTRGGARVSGTPREGVPSRASSTRAGEATAGFAADFQTGAKETGVKDAARASALARLEAARAARKAAADAERREVERQASTRAAAPAERGGPRAGRRRLMSFWRLSFRRRGERRARVAASLVDGPRRGGGRRHRRGDSFDRRGTPTRPIPEPPATRNTETETETASERTARRSRRRRPRRVEPELITPNRTVCYLRSRRSRTDARRRRRLFCDDASSRRLETGDAERFDWLRAPPRRNPEGRSKFRSISVGGESSSQAVVVVGGVGVAIRVCPPRSRHDKRRGGKTRRKNCR